MVSYVTLLESSLSRRTCLPDGAGCCLLPSWHAVTGMTVTGMTFLPMT